MRNGPARTAASRAIKKMGLTRKRSAETPQGIRLAGHGATKVIAPLELLLLVVWRTTVIKATFGSGVPARERGQRA